MRRYAIPKTSVSEAEMNTPPCTGVEISPDGWDPILILRRKHVTTQLMKYLQGSYPVCRLHEDQMTWEAGEQAGRQSRQTRHRQA